MWVIEESTVKFSLVVSFLYLFFSISTGFSRETYGALYVKIKNIRNTKGSLKIALVDKELNIEDEKELKDAVKLDDISVSGKEMVYRFRKIVHGKYSFIVFHDENDNDKLDKDLFDSPLEGFGYSNNPKIKKQKPTFKESVFDFKENDKTIVVEMKYL